MASSGPYATPFLLNAVLAQSARFSDNPETSKMGHYFARRALNYLPTEIDIGSSIPAIQGLLIFSARECACGRNSQGWLYSGMAFRMAKDIGLHIPPEKLNGLSRQFSDEESALRLQLYWSCYTWDKTMSLCLGRAPTMHQPDHVMPQLTYETMLDGEDAENELWSPRFTATSAAEVVISQKSQSSTRFIAFCELCIVSVWIVIIETTQLCH